MDFFAHVLRMHRLLRIHWNRQKCEEKYSKRQLTGWLEGKNATCMAEERRRKQERKKKIARLRLLPVSRGVVTLVKQRSNKKRTEEMLMLILKGVLN